MPSVVTIVKDVFSLRTIGSPIFLGTDLLKFYESQKSILSSRFLQLQRKGSGLTLTNIIKMSIFSLKYGPLERPDNQNPELNIDAKNEQACSSYFDVGSYWRNKKALIVPQNKNDKKSFLYAVATAKFRTNR